MRKPFEWLTDAVLILLVVSAPLAFGSVHVWAYSIIELAVFSLFAVRTCLSVSKDFRIPVGSPTVIYVSAAAFLMASVIQIIPLPESILTALSPKAQEFFAFVDLKFGNRSAASGPLLRPLSLYPLATYRALARCLALFIIFVIITRDVRGERRIERLVLAVLAAGLFEALYGIYRYFSKDYAIWGHINPYNKAVATGTYVSPNHYAGYLGLILPLAAGYIIHVLDMARSSSFGARSHAASLMHSAAAPKLVFALAVAATSAIGIVLSSTRMALAASLGAFIAITAVTLRGKRRSRKGMILAILLICILSVAALGTGALGARLSSVLDQPLASRIMLWHTAAAIAADFPLAGTGLGTFETVFQRYKPEAVWTNQLRFDHAHNDYLEIVSEAGMLGAVPALVSIVALVVLLLKRIAAAREGPGFGIAAGTLGAVVYMLLHGITDFNFHIPANALTLVVLAALGIAATSPQTAEMESASRPHRFGPSFIFRALPALAWIAVVGVSMNFVILNWRAESVFPTERDFTRPSQAEGRGAHPMPGAASRALGLMPTNYRHHAELGKFYLDKVKRETADYGTAKGHFTRAVLLNPLYTDGVAYLATLEMIAGEPLNAIALFETALDLEPANFFLHTQFGIELAGSIDRLPATMRNLYLLRARDALGRGMALNPELHKSLIVAVARAEIADRLGDRQGAIAILKRLNHGSQAVIPQSVCLAGLYVRTGDVLAAIRLYSRILAIDGLSKEHLALIIASLKRDIPRAYGAPDHITLRRLLGTALKKAGAYEEAVAAFKDVLSDKGIMGDRVMMLRDHMNLGGLYEIMGMKDAARAEYLSVLSFDPAHAEAIGRITRLGAADVASDPAPLK